MIHKILLTTVLSVTLLFGCRNTTEKKSTDNPNKCTQYACPMHPDKTSTTPAKCPECNMEMEKVIKKGSSSNSTKADNNENK